MKKFNSLLNIGGLGQIKDTCERQRNKIGACLKTVVIQLFKS